AAGPDALPLLGYRVPARDRRSARPQGRRPSDASVLLDARTVRPAGARLMLFPTVQFAIFLPIVLALSWALMARPRLWKPFIIVASYVFYAAANPLFCLLLGGITLGNQGAAKLIQRTEAERARSWIVGLAVTLDLLVLAVFKYYAFFVSD